MGWLGYLPGNKGHGKEDEPWDWSLKMMVGAFRTNSGPRYNR